LSTRIAVVADKHVVIDDVPQSVVAFEHPFVRDFFRGGRGRRAQALLQSAANAV